MTQIDHSVRAYDGAKLVWHRRSLEATLSDGSVAWGPWFIRLVFPKSPVNLS